MQNYALQNKVKTRKLEFICISRDINQFKRKVMKAYQNKKSFMDKWEAPLYSLQEYLDEYNQVLVTVITLQKNKLSSEEIEE